MHFFRLRDQLVRDLPRHCAALVAARSRDPALAFDTPGALRIALCDRDPATFPQRDVLVRSVLAEHRRQSHPLWPALLIVAFSPLLMGLRRRIATSAPTELDQALLVAFLESVERVPLRKNIAARLRCATERAIFRALGREQRRQARTTSLDAEVEVSVRLPRALVDDAEDATSISITEVRRRAPPDQPNAAAQREVA
ncbi:MAG TPA: hypothetical protein VGG39_37540 [Polyangiaceae bacterium]|jgi:hypothetical protein